MLEGVDVEVDGAVEGGEKVADGGDVGQPVWPGQLYSLMNKISKRDVLPIDDLLLHLLLGTVPRYWGSTSHCGRG